MTVSELANIQNRKRMQLIDVRSTTEFAAGHVPGAANIPMDQMEARLDDVQQDLPIVLICKSGTRAGMVSTLLQQCRQVVSVLEGGTDAWVKAELPLVISTRTRWALERQVRLAAGILVVSAAILAATVNISWLYLCGFVGLGLTFAGFTDVCPMGILLAKMPWNGLRHCTRRAASSDGASTAEGINS
jgi:rhodanese-related sulfurtransferase